ncbi:MAG: isoleucine--tRNA ligase [Aeriscardovia sp.]|nr:isoleucine--tRNA ligase [Aeriscardovia sp.]
MEKEILSYWRKENTFEKSMARRRGAGEFVFFDGPPFANGLPHYGHLLTGYAKDVIPRYQTMRGKKVERVFNWDTHGLPAELEAERELGLTCKAQIDQMGVALFNRKCRESVLKYSSKWKEYINRQGRWVSFESGIKTMDLPYMESVIWAFKELFKKGLIYNSERVLPYCPVDETPLSNHELHMDSDVYKPRQDRTVTVAVKLKNSPAYLLFWTTTPWTLPSNLAMAVGPEIEYVKARCSTGPMAGKSVYIAKSRLEAYKKALGEVEIERTLKGKDMEGWEYFPPTDYLSNPELPWYPGPNAWKVYEAAFVTQEDGTGIVHQAPYGEDDMETIHAHGILPFDVTDSSAKFKAPVLDYEGLGVFEACSKIIRDFKNSTGPLSRIEPEKRPILVEAKDFVHSYPHCWRCGSPLIYKPVSSWFVKVTAIKDKLLKGNQKINWIPENVKNGQFGKWLEGARDWSITRNRYWGTPIPIWISTDPAHPRMDVYGSLEEIERDFGSLPRNESGEVDLHRPWIDSLSRPNPDDPTGKSEMRRVKDVLDVWFDSACISFAQKHFPFENREEFLSRFPADFVVEYIGQTRGWFYVQNIITQALFNDIPFKNVVCHGIVLGSDGNKMSKHLRNYPDVSAVFDEFGSDALRWFLMSSPILRGGNLIVTSQGIKDTVRKVLIPLWNAYSFFALYANAYGKQKGYKAKRAENGEKLTELDRFILSSLSSAVCSIQNSLDDFAISEACKAAEDFIDRLTNWYIRNSRQRFWQEEEAAFDTLYTVLETFSQAVSPLLPFEAEAIFRSITGKESVHLEDWPDSKGLAGYQDKGLESDMNFAREVVSSALSIRKEQNIRVRQPLRKLDIVSKKEGMERFEGVIKRELDVKEVDFLSFAEAEKEGFKVEKKLSINPRVLGPRIGGKVQEAIKASKEGKWEEKEGEVCVEAAGEKIRLLPEEYSLSSTLLLPSSSFAKPLSEGGFVILDCALDEELEAEGEVRDLIRQVQEERKKADFKITDRISLKIYAPSRLEASLEKYRDQIAAETLASNLEFEKGKDLKIDLQLS